VKCLKKIGNRGGRCGAHSQGLLVVIDSKIKPAVCPVYIAEAMPSPEARGPQCQGPPQGSFCLTPSSLSLQGITQQIMELRIQLMDQEVT